MKTNYAFLFVCLLTVLGLAHASSGYYQGEYMPPQDAQKKWGIQPVNKELFKGGDPTKRASMAVDIASKSLYVGKPMKVVREELGDPDSYFFSDTIYAYKIMPFPGENKEVWHLVFIPDDNLEKVKEVKIHKKCCYKSSL